MASPFQRNGLVGTPLEDGDLFRLESGGAEEGIGTGLARDAARDKPGETAVHFDPGARPAGSGGVTKRK